MGPKSTHQGVLQEYEKTKHRSDNSILRVMARVKNQNNLVKTATESPVTSSQSDHAQTMMTDVDIAQSLIHKGKILRKVGIFICGSTPYHLNTPFVS